MKLVNFVKVMRHELIAHEIYISWEAGFHFANQFNINRN